VTRKQGVTSKLSQGVTEEIKHLSYCLGDDVETRLQMARDYYSEVPLWQRALVDRGLKKKCLRIADSLGDLGAEVRVGLDGPTVDVHAEMLRFK